MTSVITVLRKIWAVIVILSLAPGVPVHSAADTVKSRKYQKEHLAYLEEYYRDYVPKDEGRLCTFDLEKALEDGVRLNEISYIATHNSYQKKCSAPYAGLYRALDTLLDNELIVGGVVDFESEDLTTQLETGIRSFEIDVEARETLSGTEFVTCHNPLLDVPTTCYSFAGALREIKTWSDHNPGHLPLTVMIEPKNNFAELFGYKDYSIEYAKQTDELIREIMGDSLLTPADMLGEYESFRAMREADGWPLLKDTTGKVMFVLHLCDVTDEYVALDSTMKTQAMLPGLVTAYKDAPYCGFIIVNDPFLLYPAKDELLVNGNFLIRCRADQYARSDPVTTATALACMAQNISTDYPVHSYTEEGDYTVSFENGKTVSFSACR